jgi:glycosyltransferase involved in cell wall biosynthesis
MTLTHALVVFSYNQSSFVFQCIESIANQTVLPNKIIWFDDCSNDDTVSQISSILHRNERLKEITNLIVNKKNMGIYGNMNQSFVKWECDYVHFLSCDDWFVGDYFLNFNNFCKFNGLKSEIPHIVACDHLSYIDKNLTKVITYSDSIKNVSGVIRFKYTTRNLGMSYALFESLDPFDSSLGIWADRLFEVAMCIKAKNIYLIPSAHHCYRVGVGYSSVQGLDLQAQSLIVVNKTILDSIGSELNSADRRYIHYCMARDYLMVGFSFFRFINFLRFFILNVNNGIKLSDFKVLLPPNVYIFIRKKIRHGIISK